MNVFSSFYAQPLFPRWQQVFDLSPIVVMDECEERKAPFFVKILVDDMLVAGDKSFAGGR